ncbi:glycerol acyltransferase [Sphingomonas sp. Leaf231]|uniref:lysophospholipid acyltransferase family protein n=1 Tax=Sphingomonas sp. Leaf231 TaxID=1736301 RepID=UPI0006F6BB0E|nr:lysophospholipid acyltransferase family protein [Sphingomonas sp. Leaf231]KQN93164.1 glycerol acyltransferase [Sphingomonas sp. Leaf231]
MKWLRTIAFRTLFYIFSVPIVATTPIAALFGQRILIAHSDRWSRLHRLLMRWVLGITPRVEGEVPAGQYLYVSKHEAMYETLELQLLLGSPAVVLKRELMRIPLWGWAAKEYGALVVDREASSRALRALMREGAAVRGTGRSVIVYAEGTRVPHGESPPLRSGFAGLYKALDLPVVPIALDSGRLLPKKGAKRSGTITIRIGEPIPAGLPRRVIEAQVHAAINVLNKPAD